MQHRTRVKFCGITRRADAELAVELGVDALGFVFHPDSPRYIEPNKAAEIIANLPPFVTAVGLVVNRTSDEVNGLIAATSIDLVQCHGDETASTCEQLTRPYIKALRVKADTDIAAAAKVYHHAKGILLDAYVPGIPGGSGQRFDWQQAHTKIPQALIMAGGLTIENVRTAIEEIAPYAVDVSTGIESAPGVKDRKKMTEFMQQARHADG